jgi:O-antigen/teichoic acid export membrane protein
VTPPPPPAHDGSPDAATSDPGPGAGRLRRLLASPLIRQNLLYLLGIGGSGAGVLIAQSYAAHHLTAIENGESTSVVAVLNLLYTTSFVVAAGAAREVAATVSHGVPAIQRWADLRRSTWRIGLALAAIMIPVDFLLAVLLHLPHPEVLVVTVVAGPLSAFAGAQRGYLQGSRDFRRLAINFLFYGGTVFVVAVVLLHLHLGAAAVPVATVGGATGSALYPRHRGAHLNRASASPRRLIDHTVVAGAATAPLFNNIDVVAARHVLSPGGAGLYSGLSVMGKIIFFGTSSLSAVMYPRIAAAATASARRRLLLQTLAALGAMDAVALLAYGLLAPRLLKVVLGPQYIRDSSLLFLFAVGVVALTFVNLLVYYGMGARTRHFAIVPAIGVPALIAWLFASPPAVSDFVPRIASALVLLAVLEAVLVLPGVFRREDRERVGS